MSDAENKNQSRSSDLRKTLLPNGSEISKASYLLEVTGTLEEMSSYVGFVFLSLGREKNADEFTKLREGMRRIQRQLLYVEVALKTEVITERFDSELTWLKEEIAEYSGKLSSMEGELIAGATRSATYLEICRTICRRAERNLVRWDEEHHVAEPLLRYVDALSDLLYYWERWLVEQSHASECIVLPPFI